MFKKILLTLCALWFTPLWAQNLTLAISEGTSGGLDHGQVAMKYQGLADLIGRSIGRRVTVVPVREFTALESGMKNGRFDFVFARPSDYPARALKSYGYQFLASAKPDGQCYLVTLKDSPIKKLEDLRGKRFALPEKRSYMTHFCRAELSRQGIDLSKEKVQYVREQDAVTFYLKHNLADVGAVASYSGAAQKWQKDGNLVLHKSVSQPYFPLIASAHVAPAQREAIRTALGNASDNTAGQNMLKAIGIEGFDLTSEARLRQLLDWLAI